MSAIVLAQELRTVLRRDADRLQGRETRFDEQLDLALISESGKYAAEARRIFAREEEPARFDERALEFHLLLEQCRRLAAGPFRGRGPAPKKIRPRFRRERRKDARGKRRPRPDERLEHGQSRRDRDVARHEIPDHRLCRLARKVQREDGILPGPALRAFVRFLAGDELRVDEKAVLEVVDPERGRLAESDRAEVPGDLQVPRVRRLRGRLELGAGDVHVRLEGGRALRGPVLDGPARVVGARELEHDGREGALALEVWARDAYPRARDVAGVDRFREL